MTGTLHSRVAVVSPLVKQEDLEFLGHFGRVVVVDLVQHDHRIKNKRYRDIFTKLRLWQLTMYDKVLYVDADIVIQRSIDDLFDLPTWGVPLDREHPRYNTGMMLLHPSLERFDDMMEKLQTSKTSMSLPTVWFLTEYFNNLTKIAAENPKTFFTRSSQVVNPINLFSRWYQVYQAEFKAGYKTYLTEKKESITIYDPRVRGIHYTLSDKPWVHFGTKFLLYAPSFCVGQDERPFPNDPYFVWYSAYAKLRYSYSHMRTNAASDLPPLYLNQYLSDEENSANKG